MVYKSTQVWHKRRITIESKDMDVTVLEERPWDTACPCELKWSTQRSEFVWRLRHWRTRRRVEDDRKTVTSWVCMHCDCVATVDTWGTRPVALTRVPSRLEVSTRHCRPFFHTCKQKEKHMRYQYENNKITLCSDGWSNHGRIIVCNVMYRQQNIPMK